MFAEKIKGAIFDLDGTLVDSLGVWSECWEEFGKRFLNGDKFQPTDDEEKAVRTKTLKASMEYIYSIYKFGENPEVLYEIFMDVLENYYATKVQVKEGVAEFLEYCRKNNIKMCIASATDIRLIKVALKHCGIDKYFIGILSCADIGKGKEFPDIYLKAMEVLKTEREETCVFEDSSVAITTAAKSGFKTVGIYDKHNFGHEEIKRIADEYIERGETLIKLIGES